MKLSVKDISFAYKKKLVLHKADFQINQSELVAILGPNGVGKTTLLKCINHILKPFEGQITIMGEDIKSMSLNEVAANISCVFQKEDAPRITVYDAILLGRKPYVKLNSLQEKDYKIAANIIDRLGLNDLALRFTDELSGGEFQKVCIARALVQEPEIMLLDEPVSALDLRNQLEIMELVREIVSTQDIIAVMTVHDINLAIRYAHKLVFVKDGQIYTIVKPNELTNEIIQDVYGVCCEIKNVDGYKFVYPIKISERE